jgi:hypothetical protein
MQTKLAQTTFMLSLANMTTKSKNINIYGFWTNYPLYTDALTHRNIGTKENCMHPKIIADMIDLMLKDVPSLNKGKVLIDNQYLSSKGISPKKYALGSAIMTLDSLFFQHLKK